MAEYNEDNMAGLTTEQAEALARKYGANELAPQKKESLIFKILHILGEPMFLLLMAASAIYFVLGEPADGAVMLAFVSCIIGIDIIQEFKTDKTLRALRDLSAPHVSVMRDGTQVQIPSSALVPGDIMLVCEGTKIPADGIIIKCSDFCVDESSLTGEAQGVWKDSVGAKNGAAAETDKSGADEQGYFKNDRCYAGTLVIQGTATVRVEKIGAQTEYGKIGASVAEAPQQKTPLQKQTAELVKICSVIAAALFVLAAAAAYANASGTFGQKLTAGVLSGITLAMAMIPEEFPVILTVFLSMGAWRLAKKNSLIRRLPSVETLGAVSVLCVDKTGTITMNKMTVSNTWQSEDSERELGEIMGLGCEVQAYDPMERAMLDHCAAHGFDQEQLFSGQLIKEYAFTNELKMMGHVWLKDGRYTIACKGSPEKIIGLCDPSAECAAEFERQARQMSEQGLRVIAAAYAQVDDRQAVPESIKECKLTLCGLAGLYDPPRESVKKDIEMCARAGIRVIMITGDNGTTAAAIARQVGIKNCQSIITGDMLEQMSDDELREKVKTADIFSRVVPEHKMRIVKALKQNGEIVGMTGDGVNDAPALKFADIGISMGKRGSEVSREAADLILTDDNFSVITDTIRDGRRIYDNIKKAMGYVLTIHIPIAAASLIAPAMKIGAGSLLFLPLHIVLMELIIDPTCSIVLERQPAEKDIMERGPRAKDQKIVTGALLAKSLTQGIMIWAASFGAYLYMLPTFGAQVARTVGIVIIMLANLFLVQVNGSDSEFAVVSARGIMKDRVMQAVNILTLAGIAVIVYSPLNSFLRLAPLSPAQLCGAAGLAAASVLWYELVKAVKKIRARKRH